MDDTERMREVLARGMGCVGCVCRGLHGLPEAGWKTDDYGRIITQSDWRPDEDWAQCGMVIEAMARKRFLVHMSIYTREDGTQVANATCSRFTPGPPAEWIHATSESIDSDSIPLVACEAMARALEAANEVS